MGAVYLAERDDDEFLQHVAIKVVRGLLDPERVRQFRAERQILAWLEHPNIARLLDGGTTADGLPYLVMEHVEGVPIDRYCDAQRLTVDDRLQLFLVVCDAVSHAHRSLIVHRDIKPSQHPGHRRRRRRSCSTSASRGWPRRRARRRGRTQAPGRAC